MPQMAPMMWLDLMTMTLFTFLCFLIINYYIFLPNKKSSHMKTFTPASKIWKW